MMLMIELIQFQFKIDYCCTNTNIYPKEKNAVLKCGPEYKEEIVKNIKIDITNLHFVVS